MTPTELTCPGCNSVLPDGASTCPECGADLTPVLRLEMEPYLLYNQGLSLVQSGDREAAILKLRSAVAAMPGEPEAYILLGKIYAQMGDFSQARRWWEAALRRWPEEPAARQGLGALEAEQTKAQVKAGREQARQKWQGWLSSAAYFVGGGLLVALFLLAWSAWRGQALPDAMPSPSLAVAAALTPTASPLPPTETPPTATPTPSQTPLPTSTAAPTVSPSPQPTPTPDLASLVENAIRGHARLAGLPIQVEQQGSAILLQGEAPSIALKYLLEALAKGVPGVELVDVSGVRVVYRVKSGDTLSEIALRMYGQASQWMPIMRANDLANPNRIYPEQSLVIPPPDE